MLFLKNMGKSHCFFPRLNQGTSPIKGAAPFNPLPVGLVFQTSCLKRCGLLEAIEVLELCHTPLTPPKMNECPPKKGTMFKRNSVHPKSAGNIAQLSMNSCTCSWNIETIQRMLSRALLITHYPKYPKRKGLFRGNLLVFLSTQKPQHLQKIRLIFFRCANKMCPTFFGRFWGKSQKKGGTPLGPLPPRIPSF